jgi:ethanolamine permease
MIFCVYIERPVAFEDLVTGWNPMSEGLKMVLHLSSRIAVIFVIVPCYSRALGFIYASKHLTQSLALSGLITEYFRATAGENKVPIRALLTCSAIQFVIVMIVWATNGSEILFLLVVTSVCIVFCGYFGAFIAFRHKFGNLDRSFVSPLGEAGAVIGILLSLIVLSSSLFMQKISIWNVVFFGYLLLAAIYSGRRVWCLP